MNAQKLRLVRIGIAACLLVPILVLEYISVPSWCRYLQLGLAISAFLIVGYDVLWKTARRIAHLQFLDENFLMTIACLGAFAIGEYPEAVAVMLFSQLGNYLEKRVVESSRKSIRSLLAISPDTAHVVGMEEEQNCEEIPVGTHILVKVGERVPLDGLVVEGQSELDYSSLNGESMPRSIGVGQQVLSGAINMTAAIVVITTKPYGESTAAKMIRLIEQARSQKAPVENFVSKFAKYFTPIVVGAALLLAVIPPLCVNMTSWDVWATWLKKALVFLVVSCPCAIVISVPLTYFGAIGLSSRLGILVKGGYVFDQLSRLRTIALDKTGTITKGKFAVVSTHGDADIAYYAALAEQNSNHPIARSVLEYYHSHYDTPLKQCHSTQEMAGMGVIARLDETSDEIFVGNRDLLAQKGIECQAVDAVGTILYVALATRYLGYMLICDAPKEDSAKAIDQMRQSCRVVMLSGDNIVVAKDVAKQVGIDEVRAQLLPPGKVDAVRALAKEGPVAFVGDGVNDSPVLVASDVGFAMGGIGQDAAIESADIVLTNDSLLGVEKARRIAQKTQRIVKENIVFALVVKFGVMALSLTSFSTSPIMMWLAVAADVGVSAICIGNALRTTRIKQ